MSWNEILRDGINWRQNLASCDSLKDFARMLLLLGDMDKFPHIPRRSQIDLIENLKRVTLQYMDAKILSKASICRSFVINTRGISVLPIPILGRIFSLSGGMFDLIQTAAVCKHFQTVIQDRWCTTSARIDMNSPKHPLSRQFQLISNANQNRLRFSEITATAAISGPNIFKESPSYLKTLIGKASVSVTNLEWLKDPLSQQFVRSAPYLEFGSVSNQSLEEIVKQRENGLVHIRHPWFYMPTTLEAAKIRLTPNVLRLLNGCEMPRVQNISLYAPSEYIFHRSAICGDSFDFVPPNEDNTLTKAILSSDELEQLQIGDEVDHRDLIGKFEHAVIQDRRGSRVKLHYVEWSRVWDCWADVSTEPWRFAKPRSISGDHDEEEDTTPEFQVGDLTETTVFSNGDGVWRYAVVARICRSGQVHLKEMYGKKMFWVHGKNKNEVRAARQQQPEPARESVSYFKFSDCRYVDRVTELVVPRIDSSFPCSSLAEFPSLSRLVLQHSWRSGIGPPSFSLDNNVVPPVNELSLYANMVSELDFSAAVQAVKKLTLIIEVDVEREEKDLVPEKQSDLCKFLEKFERLNELVVRMEIEDTCFCAALESYEQSEEEVKYGPSDAIVFGVTKVSVHCVFANRGCKGHRLRRIAAKLCRGELVSRMKVGLPEQRIRVVVQERKKGDGNVRFLL